MIQSIRPWRPLWFVAQTDSDLTGHNVRASKCSAWDGELTPDEGTLRAMVINRQNVP
jgi:hypothetical protein